MKSGFAILAVACIRLLTNVALLYIILTILSACADPGELPTTPPIADGVLSQTETELAEKLVADEFCSKTRAPNCSAETLRTFVGGLWVYWGDNDHLAWKAYRP